MKIHRTIFAYMRTSLDTAKRTFSPAVIPLQLEMAGESLMENVTQ